MKRLLSTLSFAVSSLFALTAAARDIDAVAVARRATGGENYTAPTAQNPVAALVVDGGLIEGGDTVGGEIIPPPQAVAAALRTSLVAQGYQPAKAGETPSLALVYHWGSLRVRHFARPMPDMDPNLQARIALVAPPKTAYDLRSDMELHSAGQPSFIHQYPDWRDALQLAHDDRYFVTVTAYDYAALMRGETVALWRTRLSAADNSGSLDETVEALAAGIGQYLGRDLSRSAVTYARIPRFKLDAAAAQEPGYPSAPLLTGGKDEPLLQTLVKREHDEFSGDRLPPRGDRSWDHPGKN
ncbi:hypothetical protein DB347_13950 [Opitutaceae bacterium EW11]|nr:hypothetical protein DB347_13950 [Opitutaceae bacterium EW11]